MKAVLVNYNFTPTWLLTSGLDYLIYDRSDGDSWLADFPKERIIKTKNIGNVDYDKLSFLVENYDTLPDVFLWGKTNLFKYISTEEYDEVKDNTTFTPLLTQHHKTYMPVCYYENGMYYEINDSWYLHPHYSKYFNNWAEWAKEFCLPNLPYIPFAPGGNYILTKATVHRHGKDMYESMKSTMEHAKLPGEAQLAERSYYLMWK